MWFDVEEKGNTTESRERSERVWLWFDVEEKGNTTIAGVMAMAEGCGLM